MGIIDFFKQPDKQLHLIISFIIACIDPFASVCACLAKEYVDYKCSTNDWSWGDMIANAIGILLGTMVNYFFVIPLIAKYI